MSDTSRLTLAQVARNDLLRGLGLERSPARHLLTPLVNGLVQGFASEVLAFDRRVASEGFPGAAESFLAGWGCSLTVRGGPLPENGPLLLLSNHPGLTDSLALMAALKRKDLTFFAQTNPFLEALPEVREHLLLMNSARSIPPSLLRRGVQHLQQGGALALYPAGRIEPDPAIHSDAVDSLAQWSPSVAFFAKRIPETRVVIAMVRGCISPRAQHHWLTHLRRSRVKREELAAMLQVVIKAYRARQVELDFSGVAQAGELLAAHGADGLFHTVLERGRRLLVERDAGEGWG